MGVSVFCHTKYNIVNTIERGHEHDDCPNWINAFPYKLISLPVPYKWKHKWVMALAFQSILAYRNYTSNFQIQNVYLFRYTTNIVWFDNNNNNNDCVSLFVMFVFQFWFPFKRNPDWDRKFETNLCNNRL